MLIIKILLLIVLALMFYQDMFYQAIYWFFFPLGIILNIIISLKQIVLFELFINTSVNLLFVFFQLAVIYCFTWIKFKKRTNIFNSVFGLGDFLFLIMISLLFSPLNFITFFIISVLFSLILYTSIKSLNIYKKTRVPLAGLQSLFLIFVIIMQFFSKFSFYNDYQILQLIQ